MPWWACGDSTALTWEEFYPKCYDMSNEYDEFYEEYVAMEAESYLKSYCIEEFRGIKKFCKAKLLVALSICERCVRSLDEIIDMEQ
jgi:hypothetical protein